MPKVSYTSEEQAPVFREQDAPRQKRSFFRKYIVVILLLLVVILAGLSTYFYKKSGTHGEKAAQAETKSLVTDVGKIAVLPNDETPTIATVSDPSALANQAFFADAQKGDKVLIYSNAKKAFLYRPSTGQLVNIAPLNMGAATDTTTEKTADTKN